MPSQAEEEEDEAAEPEPQLGPVLEAEPEPEPGPSFPLPPPEEFVASKENQQPSLLATEPAGMNEGERTAAPTLPTFRTNWVGQILTDLVTTSSKHTENFNRVDDEELEEFPYLEVGDAEKYQRMENLPSRRVIFTHLLPHNLPASVLKSEAKILLLIRNPKDVATSFYHFSNGLSPLPTYKTFDDFFTAFMNGEMPWGSYFDYVFEWNKHADKKNVMTVTYEELKENRALGVKKISEFFEFPLTDEELQEVVDRSSFQAMKENSTKTHGAMGSVLFRKGSVNDWKNFFSEDHNQKMDIAFEERLGGTKLGEKLNYGVYCKA